MHDVCVMHATTVCVCVKRDPVGWCFCCCYVCASVCILCACVCVSCRSSASSKAKQVGGSSSSSGGRRGAAGSSSAAAAARPLSAEEAARRREQLAAAAEARLKALQQKQQLWSVSGVVSVGHRVCHLLLDPAKNLLDHKSLLYGFDVDVQKLIA